MKKIENLLLLGIVSLLTACSAQEAVIQQPYRPVDSTAHYTDRKKPVDGLMSILTDHPDSNTIKGKDKLKYYELYDLNRKCLFITEQEKTYTEIVEWLPVHGIETHYVKLTGPTINPITYFDPQQLAEISKRMGRDLNEFLIAVVYTHNVLELKDGQTIVNGVVLSASAAKVPPPSPPAPPSPGTSSGSKYNGTKH